MILPRSITRSESQKVQFTCRANGFPRPKVIWIKDGNVVSDQEPVLTGKLFVTSNFTIHRVTRANAGEYICAASNQVRTVFKKADLNFCVLSSIPNFGNKFAL